MPARDTASDGEPHLTPADAWRWAAQDIFFLPADVRPHTVRYVSTYNFPPSQRMEKWKDVAFAINSISRAREIVIPPIIPGTENSLIRIDLYDYDIDPEQWDRLFDLGSGRSPLPEPYFSERYEKDDSEGWEAYEPVPGKPGVWRWREIKGFIKGKLRPARWVYEGAPGSGQLVFASKTRYPVARADWFVSYALWAPRYYDFLGLGKKIEDFDKLARARTLEDADRKVAGIVVQAPRNSRVVLNNRFVDYVATTNIPTGGARWGTYDSKVSTDERQYMNNLLDFLKQNRGLVPTAKKKKFFDATEDIANLPNGLQFYFLTDGDGNRLDKADPDIAIDKFSAYQDGQVWTPRNCISCHIEGIRSIPDAVREFSRDKIGLLVVDDDEKKTNSRLIKDYFGIDMAVLVTSSCNVYDQSVRAATKGRTSRENAASFMRLTADYLDQGIDLQTAAWEVGMPASQLKILLSRGINVDPTLTGLLKNPPELIRRDQWERNGFPGLMRFLIPYRKK